MKKTIKNILRPLARLFEDAQKKYKTFDVEISKLFRGGENGIRAAKYAELTNNFLRPSTPVKEGPHVKFLELYDEIGDRIFEENTLKNTPYYKNALECINLTGRYFYDRPEGINTLAERFIRQHKGEDISLPQQPGQSAVGEPIWVRPIRDSSCYEVIDGNHRIARAIMRKETTIPVLIYEKEPTYTPLQQLLLDCLWINKQKWLYQPIDSLELKDSWVLIRQCSDRLEMMLKFLKKHKISKTTYIDIGSSYGFLVKEMTKQGFEAYGMERDPFGMDIGFKVYGIPKEKIIHNDIVRGLENEIKNKKKYSVVSCLSVLHHFVLGKSSTTAEDLLKMLDSITKDVLFIDTGEEHETAFAGALKGWSPKFIQQWILKNSSFKNIIPLGIDLDRRPPFEGYYSRTLFVCKK